MEVYLCIIQLKREALLAALIATGLCGISAASIVGADEINLYLLSNGNIGNTVDENCNGTLNGFLGPQAEPCGFMNDPGPGGLFNVMTYDLLNPPGLVAGDVLMIEPGD